MEGSLRYINMSQAAVSKKPSIAKNSVFYLIFSVLNALFPFLMSLYVARVLSQDAVGNVAYALNIVTYFSILAFVGIPTYGMREVAKCKDDKTQLNKLFTELYTINAITTTVSLGLYIGLVFIVPNFHVAEHLPLYLFCAILIGLNYFNVTWVYEGFEKFGLNAFINILSKAFAFAMLILFVKSEEHMLIYAILSVVGLSGYYLLSFFFFPKFVRFDFKGLQFKRHIKPILFLLAVNLAIEIYSFLDITMIGVLIDTGEPVALYKYAHQIQKTLLMVVNAFTMVIVPRLSKLFKEEKFDEYNSLLSRTFTIILIVALPMAIGVIFTSDQLVVWIYGNDYAESATILKVLIANIVISPIGYLLGSRVCLSANKEKYMPIAVGIGAVINIGLNAWFIYLWGPVGAAIASVASEICVLIIYLLFSHKYFKLKLNWLNLLKIFIALAITTGYLLLIHFFIDGPILKIVLEIVGAIIIYFACLLILRESSLFGFVKKIFKRKAKEEIKEEPIEEEEQEAENSEK